MIWSVNYAITKNVVDQIFTFLWKLKPNISRIELKQVSAMLIFFSLKAGSATGCRAFHPILELVRSHKILRGTHVGTPKILTDAHIAYSL